MIKELNALKEAIKNYSTKRVSTDEFANLMNIIEPLISDLEGLELGVWPDSLLLKWGTLKSYNFEENPEAFELIKEYTSLWSCESRMLQNDSQEQKQILCKIIDKVDWCIQSDWGWEFYTKEEAKKYVLEIND